MRLDDLSPEMSSPGGMYQTLTFLCPKCQKHWLQVDIWNGSHGDHQLSGVIGKRRLWHAEQGDYADWQTLSLSPSIDRTGMDKCGGWHGFITNGEVK